MGALAGSGVGYFHVSARVKNSMVGKGVFEEERNDGKVGLDRIARQREFQMNGAVKLREHGPFADRIPGNVRRNLSKDFIFLVGV